jgi:beta-glucosidase
MTSAEALTASDELQRLLGKLTLHHKIRPLSGDSTIRTPAEPAIGLWAMVFSDGPVSHSHPGQVDKPVPACAELLVTFDRAADGRVLVDEAALVSKKTSASSLSGSA